MTTALTEPGNEPIPLGNPVLLQVEFTNSVGALTDPPEGVTLTLAKPAVKQNEADQDITPTPNHPSTGIYTYEFVPNMSGRWDWRWNGVNFAVAQGSFVIEQSNV